MVAPASRKPLDPAPGGGFNSPMLIHIGLIVSAYLVGSVLSAVVVCRVLALGNPRELGSGNPGATNVLRLHGRAAAALTLAGDFLKGLLVVLALQQAQLPEPLVVGAGLAVFAGHLYPLFCGFRGGKGAATMAGVLLAFHWLLGAAFIITWLLMALLFRYSSLAALTAAALAPGYCWFILPASLPHVVGVALMAAALLVRHRSNIRNLLARREDRIGKPPP